MGDSAVTTVIYHRVKSHDMDAYREWQPRITAACRRFEGYIDTQLFEPGMVTPDDNEFVLVFRFESRDLLKKWIDSDTRKNLLQEARHFTIGEPKIATFTGLEHWFTQGEGPPRYKMTVVTFFAIWPLVHFLPGPINRLVDSGDLANELVAVIVITVLMSYVALPLACKVFAFWLRK